MEAMKSHRAVTRRAIATALLSLLIASSLFAGRCVVLVAASIPELSAAEQQLAKNIKSETIREVVTALSADDMQGRGTAQPGGDKAANFLADRFAKLHLKPLGDKNSYLQ